MLVKLSVYNIDTGELVAKRYMEQQDALGWLRAYTHQDGMPLSNLTTDELPATKDEVEAYLYLQATDYYVLKKVELAEDIPAGVTVKRNAARLVLDNG